jgi:hypothetical protein
VVVAEALSLEAGGVLVAAGRRNGCIEAAFKVATGQYRAS